MPNDLALFGKRLLTNPRRVSAIAPSSRHLARAITDHLQPGLGPVVEFGPGTGRFTRAILDRGIPPNDLTLFELDPEFARLLRLRFPDVTVHEAGAETAADLVPEGVATVISGLPLLSMPPAVYTAILKAAFRILRPGGTYMQFTYGPRAPVPDQTLSALGLRAEPGAKVWANLPPARVYRFVRA